MKLKLMSIVFLASFIGFSSSVLANVKQTSKTTAQQSANDKELKRFTNSISLKFISIGMSNENNQKVVNFKYLLQNTSKKSIQKVEWVSTYFYQNKPILIQNVPVTFKKLAPKQAQNLVFSIPFDNLSPIAQKVLSTPEAEISIQFQAKSILFTDKSKIVVK